MDLYGLGVGWELGLWNWDSFQTSPSVTPDGHMGTPLTRRNLLSDHPISDLFAPFVASSLAWPLSYSLNDGTSRQVQRDTQETALRVPLFAFYTYRYLRERFGFCLVVAAMNNNLYSNLPRKSYTIRDFILKAKELDQEGGPEFFEFLLSGVVPAGHGQPAHQVVLDVMPNALTEDHFTSVSRDYDSFIAIHTDLLLRGHCLSIYPVPDPQKVLRKSMHIELGEEGEEPVPLHQIPNFELGYWGHRYMVYIFFPALLDSERFPDKQGKLGHAKKAEFYELGLRPTIKKLLKNCVSSWPPDYESEYFRAKKRSGAFAYQTKLFPEEKLDRFSWTLQRYLRRNNVDWAEDFFFVHIIRGVKDATRHNLTPGSPRAALDKFLTEAGVNATQGTWYVDVGLEVSSEEEQCLQWMSSCHSRVVREALQISERNAVRITSLGSQCYEKDIVSHLSHVAGCRIEPGARAAGPCNALYLQLYTTDKSVTYAPEGRHHGKALTMSHAMAKDQPPDFLNKLQKAFTSAASNTSSNARIEVRVGMDHATAALMHFDLDVFSSSLLAFERDEWWGFRSFRALAIKEILERQSIGKSNFRVSRDALLLTATCVWLTNSLHSRPEDGPAARSLMRATLPVTSAPFDEIDPLTLLFPPSKTPRDPINVNDDDEDVGLPAVSVPVIPFGAIFCRYLQLHVEVPRFRSGGPFLTKEAVLFWFSMTIRDLRLKYHSPGVIPPEVVEKTRVVTNKTHRTMIYVPDDSENQPKLFNLASAGHVIPPPPVDEGSDREDDPRQAVEDFDVEGDIDTKLTNLWHQFIQDVITKSPNMAGDTRPSYLKLSRVERQQVGEELFKEKNFAKIFRACQWKIGSVKAWNTAFSHCFPPPGAEIRGKRQNYSACVYARIWMDYINGRGCDTATAWAMHRALKQRFLTLYWFPSAQVDKLWSTSRTPPGYTRLPPNTEGPGPQVIVTSRPLWEEPIEIDTT
ncbi:hypothetical protein VKT23_020741 [Stygiomarasmius scandens]|uniref:Uncharacterized protein n=1 Tax=Marasmiellus scandens TaxID=2682957 RepID=A0ABR1IIP4_9AGAR